MNHRLCFTALVWDLNKKELFNLKKNQRWSYSIVVCLSLYKVAFINPLSNSNKLALAILHAEVKCFVPCRLQSHKNVSNVQC